MTIQEFTQSKGFNDRDSFVTSKMYKGQDKSKSQWDKELRNKFSYHKELESDNITKTKKHVHNSSI